MSSKAPRNPENIATGARIRELREKVGISQRQLAERLDCLQPAIARLESGGVSPNVRTLERIVEALGYVLEWQVTPRDSTLRSKARGVVRSSADLAHPGTPAS
jgi:transcriptional regulator with XRE-family HTH domain